MKFLKKIFTGPASFEVEKGGIGNLAIQLGFFYACIFGLIYAVIKTIWI